MILSVSRRTDIPAFYSEWFMNRIREGNVCVRNPFNTNQISRINIKPDVVDCIVFWTKDAKPIMNKLSELDDRNYKYYFQFTITPYQNDIEQNIRDKREIVNTFIELSKMIGKDKVILRYDPIFLTDKYSMDYHFRAFEALCLKLKDRTNKIVVSFLDDYKKVSRNMKSFNVKELNNEDLVSISQGLVGIADKFGLSVETCAESIDLNFLGINHARCIDGELIEEIIKCPIMFKDKLDGNRNHCGCMKCIDIGQYDTCVHNCLYCYANVNKGKASSNFQLHNPQSPILVGNCADKLIKDRKDVKSFRIDSKVLQQNSLFDETEGTID